MQQARILRYLGEQGSATARDVAAALELSLAVVRGELAQLGPPPSGIGELILLDGDRYALAPPRPPAPEPVPLPAPCRMRVDGKHGAVTLSHTGKPVCGYCREPVAT